MEKRECRRIEWTIMSSILYAVASDESRIARRIEVVMNSTGMNAGCKTCQTVCASPVRDTMSKYKERTMRET